MFRGSDLDLRHLRALAAVADTGTFGRAADRLGYTQSAISQQVAALERVLGGAVFDRPGGPRPVELTPLGALVLGHARGLLDQADRAANDVERFVAGTVGRIDVGVFQSVLTAVVPTVLGRLRQERPGVDVRLDQQEDHELLVQGLLRGSLDLCFLLEEDPRVDSVELFVDPFVLVTRADPEAPGGVSSGPVALDRLHGAPMVAEQDQACQRQIDDGLHDHGVEPDVVFRTNDNLAVAAMVRAGMGMAVMPLLAVEVEDPRLAVHTLDPPLPARRIGLGWRRERTLSPAAARFLELAREVTAPLAHRPLATT